MSDFLEEKRREIKVRLEELAPAVAEHERLQRALDALDGLDRPAGAARAPRAAAGGGGGGGARRAGRPRGSGERSRQALDLIRQEPGLGATEIARRIGVHPNYAYRILPGLEEQGLVEKRDRTWYPKDAA
ncbi:helix-turn-helix domain-containing protein [Patulibacter defluvii]|uniref:helix-turn-helix domain-containing protein n=1 Tax=Patulibacter defluvii TaxID=3095358 RepID=UPI002A75B287|nr:helix-turn-helix domain-containing protein [Patulibacter sp. DM4]